MINLDTLSAKELFDLYDNAHVDTRISDYASYRIQVLKHRDTGIYPDSVRYWAQRCDEIYQSLPTELRWLIVV